MLLKPWSQMQSVEASIKPTDQISTFPPLATWKTPRVLIGLLFGG
jgi:hypothetical protein